MCIRTEVDQLFGITQMLDRIDRGHFPNKPKNLARLLERTMPNAGGKSSPPAESADPADGVDQDALALSTAYTKRACEAITDFCERCQRSKAWMILTRTTQPVHVVAALTVLLVASMVYPPLTDRSAVPQATADTGKPSSVANLLYLAAFCTHFGTQVWMTFVSGLALYFSLPRHTFGLCQEVLFPKYFALTAALSAATLVLYARRGATADTVQLFALGACTLLELGVRLYLAPPILRLMRAKNAVEAAAGIGNEIGQLNAGELIKRCPHYASLHRAFRSVHVAAAAANVLAMACTCVHLHHLAARISAV